MRLIITLFILINFNLAHSRGDKAPEPVTWNKDLKEWIYGDDQILDGSDLFSLQTPYRALDAAMVPISINFKINQSDEFFIKSLILVIDENPSPLVSKFKFTRKVGNASITTRVRVDKYTYVRAIAETSDNKKYMVANFVKAAGGCSAPSLADMDAVMARLGKMKMKFIKTEAEKGLNKAEFLISHPNYSGLQFNQLTRAEIPAHFINYIKIYQDDKIILEATPDISLSEDPSITFNYLDSGGPIKVEIEDSEGQTFAGKFPISNIAVNN